MIRSLIFKNFGPFRGEHRVDLRPMAYAITAHYDAECRRASANDADQKASGTS